MVVISEDSLDSILALHIAVARLGERPFRFWWNSDIVDIDGGTDLLSRLVSPDMAPISAIEGVLLVAKRAEEQRLAAIPTSASRAYSLFCPEPRVRKALRQRFRHFKTYPDELPSQLTGLVDNVLSEDELVGMIAGATHSNPVSVQEEQTSFGIELQVGGHLPDPEHLAAVLGSVAVRSPRGAYTLPYYRMAADV